MILLDEPDQGHVKEDVASGLTIRRPERATLSSRSTISLPDYETSQADYHKPVAVGGVDRRFWKATFLALGIYVALSIIIGVPLAVKNLQKKNSSLPPKWGNSASTSPLNAVTTPTGFSFNGSSNCDPWDQEGKQGDLFTATSTHHLAPNGSILIQANVSQSIGVPPFVIGQLVVDLNPDRSASSIEFTISLNSSSVDLRERTRQCFHRNGTYRGLTLLVPDALSNDDSLSISIRALFPPRSTPLIIQDFITSLPLFTQHFGDLNSAIYFDKIALEGRQANITCEYLSAPDINIQNSLAAITGKFRATHALTLDTIGAPIVANVTLVHLDDRKSPTYFLLDTGNDQIFGNVKLVAAKGKRRSSPPRFIGVVKNFNGPVWLNTSHTSSTPPSSLDLSVQNSQAPTNITLDSKFLGSFDLQTKLAEVTLQEVTSLGDHRHFLYTTNTTSRISGWVYEGSDKVGDHEGHSRIDIESSLSPVFLQL